jgi:moderate conductance mechanosensitive channel
MVLRTPPAQVDNLEWMPKKHARTQLRDHAVEIRAKMMTLPGEQFVIRRQAYAMIKKAFDENGIKFAFPIVQVAGEGKPATAAVAQRALELVTPPRAIIPT